jgi:hypothetical protein
MTRIEQDKLIFDTLHYRPQSHGTCFVVNEPGLKLISSDSAFLPAIKATLLELAKEHNWRQLYGLDYVIGAFLVLGAKYAPDTLVPFIQSLPEVFVMEVVSKIPVFFRKMDNIGSYNFEVAPARELVEFVRDLASSEDAAMQKVAHRVLTMI